MSANDTAPTIQHIRERAYQAAEAHGRDDRAGHREQTPDTEQRQVGVDALLGVGHDLAQLPPPLVACNLFVLLIGR